jgi:SAM-dependent methyltransferase
MSKTNVLLIYKIARELKNLLIGFAEMCRIYTQRIILAIREHPIEKALGIETSEPYRKKSDTSLYKDLCDYHPSPYGKIKEILGYLRLGPDDVFVDLGCGKGRVIFFVAQEKIKKVIGVEVDKNLVEITKENYRNLKLSRAPVEIVEADAATYIPNEGTVFFMYDPFGYKTVEAIVGNIKKCLETHARRIRIVYYSPGYRHILDHEDWLELEKEVNAGEILIWHNRSFK